eukprot:scaffold146_cov265-Pinguiococcus_pyrenoidosus.AAC.17
MNGIGSLSAVPVLVWFGFLQVNILQITIRNTEFVYFGCLVILNSLYGPFAWQPPPFGLNYVCGYVFGMLFFSLPGDALPSVLRELHPYACLVQLAVTLSLALQLIRQAGERYAAKHALARAFAHGVAPKLLRSATQDSRTVSRTDATESITHRIAIEVIFVQIISIAIFLLHVIVVRFRRPNQLVYATSSLASVKTSAETAETMVKASVTADVLERFKVVKRTMKTALPDDAFERPSQRRTSASSRRKVGTSSSRRKARTSSGRVAPRLGEGGKQSIPWLES